MNIFKKLFLKLKSIQAERRVKRKAERKARKEEKKHFLRFTISDDEINENLSFRSH